MDKQSSFTVNKLDKEGIVFMTVQYVPNGPALAQEAEQTILSISRFTQTPAFQSLLDELSATPYDTRPEFVKNVLLNDEELAKRGVNVPAGMLIQRSAFNDHRATLFCVSHMLSDGKRKVTITIDNSRLA